MDFNLVGRYETLARTETETEDAGSPFSHYRPGKLIGGEEPISKFAALAVGVVTPEPLIRAPVEASAGR